MLLCTIAMLRSVVKRKCAVQMQGKGAPFLRDAKHLRGGVEADLQPAEWGTVEDPKRCIATGKPPGYSCSGGWCLYIDLHVCVMRSPRPPLPALLAGERRYSTDCFV